MRDKATDCKEHQTAWACDTSNRIKSTTGAVASQRFGPNGNIRELVGIAGEADSNAADMQYKTSPARHTLLIRLRAMFSFYEMFDQL